MYELVYCSITEPNMKYDDVLNILEKSRDYNIKHNISGCLLLYNKQIVQIIEGEKDIVQGLFKKIKKDKRHKRVLLLTQGPKEERYFPNWSMAFRELRENDFNKIIEKNFINNFTAFADLAEKPTLAMHTFWSTAKQILYDDYS